MNAFDSRSFIMYNIFVLKNVIGGKILKIDNKGKEKVIKN